MRLQFHHINFVSKDVEELDSFYQNILNLDSIPIENFPRTSADEKSGYGGKIKFVTDGTIQMHLAEKDGAVAIKNGQEINPLEKGHIAFRTDDIETFKKILDENKIPFSDYGTTFAKEWYQIFFRDPVGNVIEVHQLV